MPSSLAIGEAEAAALRKFVEAGGVLIADVRPGLADESGKIGHNAAIRRAVRPHRGRRAWAARCSPPS